jgi:hypothetical protein
MILNWGVWATSESQPRASDEHPNKPALQPKSEDDDPFRSMSADQNG